MHAGRIVRALSALAAAWMLSACGGMDGAAPANRQASSQPIAVGVPNGSNIDTAPFVALAGEVQCADTHNRLYVIDSQYVLHTRAGRCADNSYANHLYGASTDKLLCTNADSIAGPQTRCSDEQARALFDIVVKNLDTASLGLDASRTVRKVELATGRIAFTDLSHLGQSGVDSAQNLLIGDAAAFNRLWYQHSGNSTPAPRIDFGRGMVVAVFMGSRPNGCYGVRIADILRRNGKLLVVREDIEPARDAICPMVMTSPGHLVLLERSDEPVEFVSRAALQAGVK